MVGVGWTLLVLVAGWLLGALALSLRLTRRSYLAETHSPAEVGLDYEEISFPAVDGVRLHGWWVPCPGSQRVIIQLHGHAGSMDADIGYLPAWHAARFNVLLFDFRAHGRSQGRLSTFGYLERRDVQGAIRFLQQEMDLSDIALVGFSLGAMTAILAAPLCPQVKAVVADGSPARIRTALVVWGLEHNLPHWLAHTLAWSALCGASLRLGASLFAYEPWRWVDKIAPRPLLLIHGDRDQYCPDFDDLLNAAIVAEVWRLPEVGHVQASQVYPAQYRRRVVDFLNRALPKTAS